MYERLILIGIGAMLGWGTAHIRAVSSENANLITEHISDIEKLTEQLQEYWLSKYNNQEEELRSAAKVRALHAPMTAFYGEAEERLTLEKLREYQKLSLRLFTVGLGGDFETSNRKFSPEVSIEVHQISAELIHVLRLARREAISLRAPIIRLTEKVRGIRD